MLSNTRTRLDAARQYVLQDEIVAVARENGVRLMGPNIYGYYYTHKNLCATFTEKGKVALSSQSGGVGMAIVQDSRAPSWQFDTIEAGR